MPLKNGEQADWYERGTKDYATGMPRHAMPTPADSDRAIGWCKGWDDAAAADAGDETSGIIEQIPVRLKLVEGTLFLVDSQGRAIGSQDQVIVEQAKDQNWIATVTFTNLPPIDV